MKWRIKRHGGKSVQEGYGFARFVDVRGLSIILTFTFSIILMANDSQVLANQKLVSTCIIVFVVESICFFLLGFLGESWPQWPKYLVPLVALFSIVYVLSIAGPFFLGKDFVIVYNMIILYMLYRTESQK